MKPFKQAPTVRAILPFLLLCLVPVSSSARAATRQGKLVPQEILDVRDAPALQVFALVLERVSVMGNFQRLVTFRLTDGAIRGTRQGKDERGDVVPVVGWLKAMEASLRAGPLKVGYEREAGTFYVSLQRDLDASGRLSPQLEYTEHQDQTFSGEVPPWKAVSPAQAPRPRRSFPDPNSPISRYRVAGIHWLRDYPRLSRAILVVHEPDGSAFARVLRQGQRVTPSLLVEHIAPASVVLRSQDYGRVTLALRGVYGTGR